jgi:hypothetical protein
LGPAQDRQAKHHPGAILLIYRFSENIDFLVNIGIYRFMDF